jgi:hypothetical protein
LDPGRAEVQIELGVFGGVLHLVHYASLLAVVSVPRVSRSAF